MVVIRSIFLVFCLVSLSCASYAHSTIKIDDAEYSYHGTKVDSIKNMLEKGCNGQQSCSVFLQSKNLRIKHPNMDLTITYSCLGDHEESAKSRFIPGDSKEGTIIIGCWEEQDKPTSGFLSYFSEKIRNSVMAYAGYKAVKSD